MFNFLVQYRRRRADMNTPNYYGKMETRLGVKILLRGAFHLGFYPSAGEARSLSMATAQRLMEGKLGETLNLPPNSRVLDAGCGEGAVAVHLADWYDLQVEGIDLLEVSIKAAQHRARRLEMADRVRFRAMDFSNISFPDDSFDGVYTMESLAHAVDFRKALQEISRVLVPGGRIALFEFTVKPLDEMSDREREIFSRITRETALHSLGTFVHGSFPDILHEAGFVEADVCDISENVVPMVKRLADIARPVHWLAGLLGIRRYFTSIVVAVEYHGKAYDSGFLRYNIVTARKPTPVSEDNVRA